MDCGGWTGLDGAFTGCWTLIVCVLDSCGGCWLLVDCAFVCVLELSGPAGWSPMLRVDVRTFSETKGGPPVLSISASFWFNLTAEAE